MKIVISNFLHNIENRNSLSILLDPNIQFAIMMIIMGGYMLDHIPKIAEEQIREQFEILAQQISQGQIQQWLNGQLQSLHDKNPVLFHYLVNRANTFAVGVTMVGDPNSISVSMAVEYMLLLNILNTGIGSAIGLKQFADMMKKWLKGEDLKGLNSVGEKQ